MARTVPVDPPCTNVGDRRRKGGEGRDADVRAGTGGRARRGENQHGKADVAQDEADESARECRNEAPQADGDEEESVQALEYPVWPIACVA